jgi:hypothetical protein
MNGVYTGYMRSTGEAIPKNVPSRKEEVVKGKGFVPPCGINCRAKEKKS